MGLEDYWPCIHLLCDEMDSGPRDLHPKLQRAFLRFEAGEPGKQRRMHVHDSVMIMIDELGAEDAKVACKSDETVFGSNTMSFQSGNSLPIILNVHPTHYLSFEFHL